jgi:hypothetical protein
MFDDWCLSETKNIEQLELINWLCIHAEKQEKEASKELPFDRRRIVAISRKRKFLII